MAEDTDTGADAKVIEQARERGWQPKESFRGNPEHWVDAPDFVARTETVMPLLRKDRDRFQQEAAQTRGELQSVRTELSAAKEAIDALVKFNSKDNQDRLKAMKTAQTRELIQARSEGNVEKEVQIQEAIDSTNEALRKANETPVVQPQQQAPDLTKTPEFQEFLRENTWFQQNPAMRGAAVSILQDLQAKGQLEGLTLAQRYAKVANETKKAFKIDDEPNRPPPKVEGNNGGSEPGGGGPSGSGKGYGDLPKEAKDVCTRQAARVVGKGRAFPTIKEWQAHYATVYFNS